MENLILDNRMEYTNSQFRLLQLIGEVIRREVERITTNGGLTPVKDVEQQISEVLDIFKMKRILTFQRTIEVEDFVKSKNYRTLKDAALGLMHKEVFKKQVGVWEPLSIIMAPKLVEGTGQFEVAVHRDLVPSFMRLNQDAKKYGGFAHVITGKYYRDLFEFGHPQRGCDWTECELERLFPAGTLPKSFYLQGSLNFGYLKRTILDKGRKYLKDNTDLVFDFEGVKRKPNGQPGGRKFTHLRYKFSTQQLSGLDKLEETAKSLIINIKKSLISNGLREHQVLKIFAVSSNLELISQTVKRFISLKNNRTIDNPGGYLWKQFTILFPELDELSTGNKKKVA